MIKKETLSQVFSYEFCEICKKTPMMAASVISNQRVLRADIRIKQITEICQNFFVCQEDKLLSLLRPRKPFMSKDSIYGKVNGL